MKLTYSYTPVGETTVINEVIAPGDATRESPIDWRPSAEGVLQPAGYPRAQEIETFARGNTIVQRSFRVWRFFSTRGAALRFTLEQEALPGTVGRLRIVNEGQSSLTWTVACGCQRAQVESDIGTAILMGYLFIGSRAERGLIPNEQPTN